MVAVPNSSGDMLSLRVMRLNRPVLVRQQCEPAELLVDEIAGSLTAADASVRADLDGASFHRLLTVDEEDSSPLPSTVGDPQQEPTHPVSTGERSCPDLIRVKVGGPGELLGLPQSLGGTYLGETFSAHVNLHNEGNQVCYNVELKISLHNGTEWVALPTTMGTLTGAAISTTPSGSSVTGSPRRSDSPKGLQQRQTGGVVDLHPGQSLSAIIHHELKDLGTHTLRCAAAYSLICSQPTGPTAAVGGGGGPAGGPQTLTGAKTGMPSVGVPWVDSEGNNLQPHPFQRIYRFSVEKPLDVKKKFHVVEADGCVFMEAQVQNLTSVPIYLERVVFEPSPHLTVVDLNGLSRGGQQTLYGGRTNPTPCLRPEGIRQFLYRLTACGNPSAILATALSSQPEASQPPGAGTSTQGQRPLPRTVTVSHSVQQPPVSAGRLDITWRSTMGERGRLQTTSLKYELPSFRDIHIKVKQLPSVVPLQSPFDVGFEVVNKSGHHLDLQLDLRNLGCPQTTPDACREAVASATATEEEAEQWPPDCPSVSITSLPALLWLGNTTRQLGALSPGATLPFHVTMLATLPGLQVISGLLIHEATMDRDYEFNELAHVLVSTP